MKSYKRFTTIAMTAFMLAFAACGGDVGNSEIPTDTRESNTVYNNRSYDLLCNFTGDWQDWNNTSPQRFPNALTFEFQGVMTNGYYRKWRHSDLYKTKSQRSWVNEQTYGAGDGLTSGESTDLA